MDPILGRDRELARLEAAVAAAADASAVITLEAPAGAGKSAVLGAATTAAAASGAVVVRCAPAAAEADLAYAALGDLFATVPDLSMLDEVSRFALEAALLRSDRRPGADLDARSVGSACLTVWRALAADATLVVAIDDVQWLDAASAAALVFAVRRLPPSGILVLATHRTDEPGPRLPGTVEVLGRLSDDVVRRVLASRFSGEHALSGRRTAAIVHAAGGNPLFALELARAGSTGADDGLVVPRSLTEVVSRRFDGLDATELDTLAAAALAARPDVALFRRLGMIEAVERAERAGVVSTASDRIAFTHPLFAAAVLARTPQLALRRLHLLLADAVDDPVESVLHSARGAEAADAALAARLSEIAASLMGRAAVEHAAEFAVLAARRSPTDDPARAERHITAALRSFQRGDPETATAMLADIDTSDLPDPVRVRELITRTYLAFSNGGAAAATRHAHDALEHCTTDVERIEVHSLLARVDWEDFAAAATHARRALELLEHTEVGLATRVAAMLAHAEARFMTGQGLDHDLFRRTIELERALSPFVADSAEAAYAALLKYADDIDAARDMFVELLGRNEDEGAVPYTLSHLPLIELWAGNWDAAEDYAQRHLDAAVRTGQHDQVAQARFNVASVSVMRGDVASAHDLANEILETGRRDGDRWNERMGLSLLAQCALAEGDATTAADLLDRWHRISESMGLTEPGYCRLQPDHVEALVACGRLTDADRLAAEMRLRAADLDRPTLVASAGRVSALVAAANGDRDAAVAAAAQAVAIYATTPLVFDHARALLTLGQIHRRFREKAAARDALQHALDIFERLGADQFVARARQDLARVGLRPPAGLGLTETERRVAELAATGRTVRQVGDELFISPKTVEANLTRVYRKLGLSGRAELATWFATHG